MRPFLHAFNLLFLGFLITLCFAGTAKAQSGTATITTDKLDYPPGSTVIITGSGFTPNETVTLQVIHEGEDGDNDLSTAHQPWPVQADDKGDVSSTWIVPPDQDELGATLKLTADGISSGLHVEWTFTDASAQTTTTLSSSVNPSFFKQSVTFTATVTSSGGTPTGSVEFKDLTPNPNVSLGTIQLTNGVAKLDYADLIIGSHNIQAIYTRLQGDNTFQNSTSNVFVQTINKANQIITFNVLADKKYGDVSFTLDATASSGLAVTYTSSNSAVATVSGSTVTIVGAGTTVIKASQTGNTNYNAAPDVSQSLTVLKATATVSLGNLNPTYTGSPLAATATTNPAGLSVSFTYDGSTTAPTNAGSYAVVGTINNVNYQGSASSTFKIDKAPAVITLNSTDLSQPYNGTAKTVGYSITPNGVTGVTVSYSQGGNLVSSPTNAGDYDVIASLTNTNYKADNATSVLHIAQANQAITFNTLSDKTYGNAPFTLGATASSGLNVSYTSSNTAVATISGSTVTIVGAGTTTINASQAGNTNYNAAPDVSLSLTVLKATATISLNTDDLSQTYNGSANQVGYTISPSGVTGVSISYKQGGNSVANPINAGDYDVVASLTNNNYKADNATGVLHIAKANQTIHFDVTPDKTFGDADFTISATSSSGLGVTFTATGNATVNVNTVHITGAGSATITAHQAGDDNYNAAPGVSQSFNIAKATSTIGVTGSNTFTYNGNAQGPSTSNVTGSSGSVTYTYSGTTNGNVTYESSTIKPTLAGNYSVTATLEADDNYLEAISAPFSFKIDRASSSTAVTVSNGTYNGSAQGGTAAVSGVGGLNQSLTITYDGVAPTVYSSTTAPTNAGTYKASASFAGDDNHTDSKDSKNFTIEQAPASISITDLNKVYNGNPQGATVTTTPADLDVIVTYNGSATVSGAAGNYTVVAKLNNSNYSATDATETLVIDRAPTNTSVTINGGTYNGSAYSGTASVSGAGGLSESLTITYSGTGTTSYGPTDVAPVNAGSYSAKATYEKTANYYSSTDTKEFTISKADAHVIVSGYNDTYDGNAHGATGTATGVGITDLSSNLDLGESFTDAPGGTAHWTFSGGMNYNDQSGDVQIEINKADVTIAATGGTFIYTGSAHAGSGTATGVNKEPLTPVTLSYSGTGLTTYGPTATAPTNAGTYSVTASFVENTNYNSKNSSPVDLTIEKATATIDVKPYHVVYDADSHTASGTAKGVEGETLAGLDLSSTVHTGAGNYTDNWNFKDETGNYNDASSTVNDKIDKAPSVTAVTVSNVTYNGSAQGGTASVTGVGSLDQSLTVTYEGVSPTVYAASTTPPTNAGTYSASASFAGDSNHEESSDAKNFTINKANAIITVKGYDVTYDGNEYIAEGSAKGVDGGPLEGLDLTGTKHTNANTYNDTWTFTDATGNYNDVAATAVIDKIAKATSATIVTVSTPKTYNGSAQGGTASVTGAGELSQSLTVTYKGVALTVYSSTIAPTDAGTYSASASFAGDLNHEESSDTKNFTIEKANTTLNIIVGGPYTYNGDIQGVQSAKVIGIDNIEIADAVVVYKQNGNAVSPVDAGSYKVYVSFAGNDNYNPSSDNTNTLTIAKADAAIDVPGYHVTYNAESHTSAGTATGVKGEPLTGLDLSGTAHIDADTYTDTWTFTDATGNYNDRSSTVTDIIDKAPSSTIIVLSTPKTYNGSAQGGTASVTGVGSLNQSLTITYEGVAPTVYAASTTAPTNAGTYSASASFAGDANHEESSDTKNFTINKANASIVVNGYNVPYDGNEHIAEGSATGVDGEPLSGLNLSGTKHTNSNTYNDTYTFTDQTGNYNDVGATAVINKITQAPSVTTVTVSDVIYNGSAQGGTASVAGVGGLNQSLTITYKGVAPTVYAASTIAPTDAGTYSASASFTGDANHTSSNDIESFTIKRAEQTITWSNPANIIYGMPLSATQLNADISGVSGGSAIGTVTYTPAAGAILHAGSGQALKVDVAATSNYNAASKTVYINVDKYTPVISLVAGGPYTYDGNTHTVQSVGMSSVNGDALNATVTYKDASNAIVTAPVNAGTYTVSASFVGNNDYNAAVTKTCSLVINKATSAVSVSPVTAIYDGNQHPAYATANGVAGLNTTSNITYAYEGTGNTVYSSSTAPVNAGTYSVTATYGGDANHYGSYSSTAITIGQRLITVAPTTGQSKVYGSNDPSPLQYTVSSGSLVTMDKFTGSLTRVTGDNVGTYAITQGTLALSSNYSLTFTPGILFSITAAPITLNVTSNLPSQQYSDLVTLTAKITGGAPLVQGQNGAAQTVTFKIGTQTMNNMPATLTASGSDLVATWTGALVEGVPGNMIPAAGKTITAVFNSPSSNYGLTITNNIKTCSLTITPEDANVTFTGNTYFTLPSTSSTSINVPLTATVKDTTAVNSIGDPNPGRISNANLRFWDGNSTTFGTVPVALVSTSDSLTGTANYTYTYAVSSNISTQGGNSLTVYTNAGIYYQGQPAMPSIITISEPGSNFVTGGGFIVNSKSAGSMATAAGDRTNFGFTMQYTKSGTNLKGQCNIIIRSNGKIYQIKSNAINTLSVGSTTSTGTPGYFNTKANYTDITDPLHPIPGPGNLDLTINMLDSSNGGQGDQVSIQLFNGSQLLYSSNWDGTKTVLQKLGGGNVQVRTSTTTTTSTTTLTATALRPTNPQVAYKPTPHPMHIRLFNNPSAVGTEFRMLVESSSREDVNIIVTDMAGRPVYVTKGAANQTYHFGGQFVSGMYLIKVIQGKDIQTSRVIKE